MKKILLCILLMSFLLKVQAQENKAKIEVDKLAESTKSWNGELLPSYSTGQSKITILKYTIPPHTTLAMHKHFVINAGVLIKGMLTVVDEKGNTLELKAGDSIIELVNIYHSGENKGNEPAEIIVFYAGTEGATLTVKKEK